PKLNRRLFISIACYLAMALVVFIILPWRFFRPTKPHAVLAPEYEPARMKFLVLSHDEYALLTHVYSVITGVSTQAQIHDAVLFMDQFLFSLPSWAIKELKLGLFALEKILPLMAFKLGRFSSLSADDQSAVLIK